MNHVPTLIPNISQKMEIRHEMQNLSCIAYYFVYIGCADFVPAWLHTAEWHNVSTILCLFRLC